MSTNPARRTREQLPQERRQLRLLAPKGKAPPVSPAQQRLQLEHNIRDEQDAVANVKIHYPATSQAYLPVCSIHNFALSPLLSPNSTASSLEQKQYAMFPPCTNIYSNKASAYGGFPELVSGNLVPGVDTRESVGPSTHYGNLELQETIQNPQGQGYWIPTLNTPEVWTVMGQPTIGAHQNQSSQSTVYQQPVQPAYHGLFQQNSQYGTCVNCPSIWRSHLESIMFSGLEDKGLSNLKRSYQHLQQHIHEAHHYGAGCALCEDLFCYHLEGMMLIEITKGDLCEVKVNLQCSFTALRDHIKETHGGR